MRLAVVSPFLDRQHGTELCIIEQLERLSQLENWRIELYSQKVQQLAGVRPFVSGVPMADGAIVWHKISQIPGPHLLKYLWWFVANQWRRKRDRRSGHPRPDLLYSPGINCFDADVIVVHIVFHEFYARVLPELRLRNAPIASWPLLFHRRLYYRLIMFLERRIYPEKRIHLVAVSRHIAAILKARFGRNDVTVIPNAVDLNHFSPEACRARRAASREGFRFKKSDFVVLLIGNDWRNKGLEALLRAAALLRDLPLRVLVVGPDNPKPFHKLIRELALRDLVCFARPSPEILQFYAATDLYVAPSLEDSFGMPIVEAMACGLPVIASVYAGASELIHDGENGFLLRDPRQPDAISRYIRLLSSNASLREKIGEAAARWIQANCSWEQNVARTRQFLEAILNRRAFETR